jgi:hypothetical protein
MSKPKSQRPKIKAVPKRRTTLVSLAFLLLFSAIGLPFWFAWGLREYNIDAVARIGRPDRGDGIAQAGGSFWRRR